MRKRIERLGTLGTLGISGILFLLTLTGCGKTKLDGTYSYKPSELFEEEIVHVEGEHAWLGTKTNLKKFGMKQGEEKITLEGTPPIHLEIAPGGLYWREREILYVKKKY